MADTSLKDSLEAPGCKDIGLDLWRSLFIGFYSEELLFVSVFIGSMFHMNHSFASEKHSLRQVCPRRLLEFLIPAEIPLLDIFMEKDVWFQQLQKQINIYKSNKTPQQNSKCNSRVIFFPARRAYSNRNLVRSCGSQWHSITYPTLTEHKGPENRIRCMIKGLICKEEPGLEL